MRLTPELINISAQFVNPVQEREIDLRGNKIALIENLGVTKNQFDTIDLSDNELRRIENFPLMTRLKTLFFNNNRINSIDKGVSKAVPNLETLILTNNYFRELEELNDLSQFKNLKNLSLLENVVIKKENYRYFLIFMIPSLKVLDFKKVTKTERENAQKLFSDGKQKTTIEIIETKKLTEEEILKIKKAIQNAKTLDEITKYEEALKLQKMPKELV